MGHKVQHSSSNLGLFLSIACAIHCMLIPVLMMAFPLLNESVIHNPVMEWAILALLVVLGIYSLNHYRKEHHNSNLPMILFGIGVTIFLAALLLAPGYHRIMTIVGSLLIAVSHGVNLSLRKVLAEA